MTVNISQRDTLEYPLRSKDMIGGRAYRCSDGLIYICNNYAGVIAFSLCGSDIVTDNAGRRFIEVNLDIVVTDI